MVPGQGDDSCIGENLADRGDQAAMQVLALDRPATPEVVEALLASQGITSVHAIEL